MIDKLPIKLAALACVMSVALWAVFNGGQESSPEKPNEHGSVIQPIAQASANPDEVGVVSGKIRARQEQGETQLDERSNADLKARFVKANDALKNGKLADGIEQLNQLTQDYPSVVEPYLNLAAIYAQQNDLEMARKTLMRGIDANKKAGMLFAGLKEVHGALAAGAYLKALDTKSEQVLVQAALPTLDAVVTRYDQSLELQTLKSRLENEAKSESLFSETQNKQIAELNQRLVGLEKNSSVAKNNFDKELAALNAQLAVQAKSLLSSQTAQREAEARVVRAEQDADTQVAQLKAELSAQQQSLTEVQELLAASQASVAEQAKVIAQAEQNAQAQGLVQQDFDAAKQALGLLQKENQELKIQQQQALAMQTALATQAQSEQTQLATLEAEELARKAAAEQAAAQQAEKSNEALARQEKNAIARIKSWASAWSAQDVDGYVTHYADNYSSSRSITREQWLEQRQVRLTNKAFIKVKVSSFDIEDLGEQFSVTFDQHYQSNTVDDIVRKRLVFDKQGDNWIDAKIVSERLVPKTKI